MLELRNGTTPRVVVRRKRPVRFELIPMIDVFMIISLFLMVMAFLPQITDSLKADLPTSKTAAKTPPATVVQMTRNGDIILSGQTVPPSLLEARLKALLASRPDLAVIIAADKRLPYEKVIGLIDDVKTAGIKHLALATARPGSL